VHLTRDDARNQLTQPPLKKPEAGGSLSKEQIQQIAQRTAEEMLGGSADEASSLAQEALDSAKSGQVSAITAVKNYLKTTETNPEERNALAQALIDSQFSGVFSPAQREEFVNFVIKLHENLPTKIDDKSLAAMKVNVEKNHQMINKLNTLGITPEKTEAIARLMLDAGIAGDTDIRIVIEQKSAVQISSRFYISPESVTTYRKKIKEGVILKTPSVIEEMGEFFLPEKFKEMQFSADDAALLMAFVEEGLPVNIIQTPDSYLVLEQQEVYNKPFSELTVVDYVSPVPEGASRMFIDPTKVLSDQGQVFELFVNSYRDDFKKDSPEAVEPIQVIEYEGKYYIPIWYSVQGTRMDGVHRTKGALKAKTQIKADVFLDPLFKPSLSFQPVGSIEEVPEYKSQKSEGSSGLICS